MPPLNFQKGGDWCNKSLGDNNGGTPRGMEDDDGHMKVQLSYSQGWFSSLGVGVFFPR